MLIPVNGYVVIDPYMEKQTKSGIFIPETTKERPMRGTIVASSGDFEEGTEVIYSKYGAIDMKYEGKDVVVVRERDIIAKVQDAV
jgi:chaperonin GroES